MQLVLCVLHWYPCVEWKSILVVLHFLGLVHLLFDCSVGLLYFLTCGLVLLGVMFLLELRLSLFHSAQLSPAGFRPCLPFINAPLAWRLWELVKV